LNETLLQQRESSLGGRSGQELGVPPNKTSVVLELSCARLAALVWAITLAILAIGFAREAYVYAYGIKTWLGPLKPFGLDSESSLGDWWGTIQFALGAMLLAVNARAEPDRRWRYQWAVLAAIFIYLSVDESVGLHERIVPLLDPLRLTGFLRYSWIIPYGIASIIIGLIYLPFLRALPANFGWRIYLAGALFVAAAAGVESIQGYCGTYSLRLCFISTRIFEEGGEMIALSLFLVTLFGLLRALQGAMTVELT
jgi:hypothetical protein